LNEFKKREHVLPQCFGKFKSGNLILKGIVCDECNQYFGDQLELPLGRDTIWGVERYRHGIKPGKQPKHKRIKFKILEGELAGIIVTPIYSEAGEHIDNLPVLQVGIFNNLTNRFDYYEPEEIPNVEVLKKEGMETKGIKLNLIFKDEGHEKQLLVNKLREQGYNFTDAVTSMEWPEEVKRQNQTWVIGDIKIDRVISRGFCKIAFNYLAVSQGRDFTLSSDFHGIRNFIRNDHGNQNEFFFVNQPPILEDDRRFKIRETQGHLIILEWQGMNLNARLSLFNMWTFLIKLSTHHSGLWIPIKGGHHFDIKSRTVNPLVSIHKSLLIHRGR